MILLSIDPGIRGCGVAIFEDKTLIFACYTVNPLTSGNGPRECTAMAQAVKSEVCSFLCAHILGDNSKAAFKFIDNYALPKITIDAIAVEWPQVYTKSKGDNNDLLPLAGVDTALYALLQPDELHTFLPNEWKGQLPKSVCHERIKTRLSADELNTIQKTRKSLLHNVLDAAGIGLYALCRFDKIRAI